MIAHHALSEQRVGERGRRRFYAHGFARMNAATSPCVAVCLPGLTPHIRLRPLITRPGAGAGEVGALSLHPIKTPADTITVAARDHRAHSVADATAGDAGGPLADGRRTCAHRDVRVYSRSVRWGASCPRQGMSHPE